MYRLKSIVCIAATLLLAHAALAAGPTITRVSPSSSAPGTAVVISGTGFTGATSVSFNGVPSAFQVDSAGSIAALVPLTATGGSITVTAPGGVATSPKRFSVIIGTWDASAQFSIASNPSGQWSYGHATVLGGSFNAYSSTLSPCFGAGTICWVDTAQPVPNESFLGQNQNQFVVPYLTLLVPEKTVLLGPQANAVIVRFTAPSSGFYAVSGQFQGIDTNLPVVDVEILESGTMSLFSSTLSGYGSTQPFTIPATFLNSGATLDFEAAYTNSTNNDNVTLTAVVNKLR